MQINSEDSIRKSWAKSRAVGLGVLCGSVIILAVILLDELFPPKPPRLIGILLFWFTVGVYIIIRLWRWLNLRRMQRINRRREEGVCVACGYDLRASKDRCPECGTPIKGSIKSIVGRIESVGYAVRYNHHSFGWPSVAAVPMGNAIPYSVKYRGEAELYPAICKLAKLVGIDMKNV